MTDHEYICPRLSCRRYADQARIAELEAALLGVLPYVSTSREAAERACMERQDSPIADAVSIARDALKPKP
jgi:hypothetical protein